MQLQLFDIYKASRASQAAITECVAPIIDNGSTHAAIYEAGIGQIPSLEEQLQPFSQPPYMEGFGLENFDGLVFNFSDSQANMLDFDSGFGSLFTTEEKDEGVESEETNNPGPDLISPHWSRPSSSKASRQTTGCAEHAGANIQ
jgi:hypothetical protein